MSRGFLTSLKKLMEALESTEAHFIRCIKPTTCCKETMQCCCYDARFAFPCDNEVPFWIACLGVTCAGGNKKKTAPQGVQVQ